MIGWLSKLKKMFDSTSSVTRIFFWLFLKIHFLKNQWQKNLNHYAIAEQDSISGFFYPILAPLWKPLKPMSKNYRSLWYFTANRKLERLQFSNSSSFVKIWSACSCEFKAFFWTFWALYNLLFYLETVGVN